MSIRYLTHVHTGFVHTLSFGTYTRILVLFSEFRGAKVRGIEKQVASFMQLPFFHVVSTTLNTQIHHWKQGLKAAGSIARYGSRCFVLVTEPQ